MPEKINKSVLKKDLKYNPLEEKGVNRNLWGGGGNQLLFGQFVNGGVQPVPPSSYAFNWWTII